MKSFSATLLSIPVLLCAGVTLHAQVVPFVDCVEPTSAGFYTAHFGYVNYNSSTKVIQQGIPLNYFTPGVQMFPSQPITFKTGIQHNVLAIQVALGSRLTWNLDGSPAWAYTTQYAGTVPDGLMLPLALGSTYCPASMSSAGCGGDLTSLVTTTLGGVRRNLANGHFTQTVTVYNSSNTNLTGIALALDNITATAALVNVAGLTNCAAPAGSPYITVAANLPPGSTASVNLDFTNSDATAAITFTPRVLGAGSR